eukprot:15433940-Alexandrium_andersonii.AAC.1
MRDAGPGASPRAEAQFVEQDTGMLRLRGLPERTASSSCRVFSFASHSAHPRRVSTWTHRVLSLFSRRSVLGPLA